MFSSRFFSASSSNSALVTRPRLSSLTTPQRAVGFSCVDVVMFAQVLQWVQPVDVLNLSLVSREFPYRVREAWRYVDAMMHDWHVHHLILQPQLNIELLASESRLCVGRPPVERRLFPRSRRRCNPLCCQLYANSLCIYTGLGVVVTFIPILVVANVLLLLIKVLLSLNAFPTIIQPCLKVLSNTFSLENSSVAFDVSAAGFLGVTVFFAYSLITRRGLIRSIRSRLQREATESNRHAMAQLNEPLLIENYGALDNV